MQVEKRRFCKQYVQIKYFEASWPGALVAHRIQPLHGSMHAHTKKRHRDDEGNQLRATGLGAGPGPQRVRRPLMGLGLGIA